MPALPDIANKAWDDRQGPAILVTVDAKGKANAVYVGCVKKFSDDKLVVADNYFNKTRSNILAGSTGVILFITKDNKSFQVKGTLEYHKSGEVYDDMNTWVDAKYPRVAATVLNVEEVYSGAEKLL